MTGPRPVPVVVMGVSATGKTTVGAAMAAELAVAFVEGDSFHPPGNIEKMGNGVPLDDDDRRPWLEALAEVIGGHAREGTAALVTCSALKRSYRDMLRHGAPDGRVFFVHLDATFDVLLPRMGERTKHFMPSSLLRSQFASLEPLRPDEWGTRIDVTPPVAQVVAAATTAVRRQGLHGC